MQERKNWLEIDDYIYGCINLDSDEKIIISVIISFQHKNKALYMSRDSFATTYGMSISTVKRKFAKLIKLQLIKDTGKGLVINPNELEYHLNIVQKLNTKAAGPGRRKNQVDADTQNQDDTTQNQDDTNTQNQVEPSQNQVDTAKNQDDSDQRIKLTPPKNQVDTELLKDNKSILQKEIKKPIIPEIDFFDDVDINVNYNFKPKQEVPKKEVSEEDLDKFLASLDI